MKSYFSIYVLLIFILWMTGACRHEEPLPFNATQDLLQELRAHIQEETHVIDFSKQGNAEKHLLRGWSFPEEQHIWAEGTTSSLLFYRYDTSKDLDLDIVCRTLASRDRQQQRTKVTLNDHEVGSFVVKPRKATRVTMTLPAALLQSGPNILQFDFAYTVTPRCDNSSDTPQKGRKLSVSFQEIRFNHGDTNTLQILEQLQLLHKSGVILSLFTKLPSRFELDLEYQSLHDVRLVIELLGEDQEKVMIRLSPKKTHYKKTITLKEGGVYNIRFVTEGAPESYIVWNRIQLHTHIPEKEAREKESALTQQGFTKLKKPDIIVYVVDTLRADHVSCYGYKRETTPNLDRFASEHALFKNAYSAASWTRASAATILTGLLPKHNKTIGLDDKLPNELVTLAEILQEHGYYTASFVTNVNLDHSLGFAQGVNKQKALLEVVPVTQSTTSDVINEHIVEFFDTFLTQEDRKPFFLLIWSMDPHSPYTPLEPVKNLFDIDQYTPIDTYDFKFVEKLWTGQIRPTASQIEYIKTRYDQEIYFNDRSFGKFLDILKAGNIYDNAIIIFTADHGEEFFEHEGVGHGRTLYNEQIKIPFVIKAPFIEPGEHQERAQLIDIYPTILDLLGIQAPYSLDGVSLLQQTNPIRTLYFEGKFGGNTLNALLDDQKKFIFNQVAYRPPLNNPVPIIESFALEDHAEHQNLELSGFEDELRVQQLFSYRNSDTTIGIKQTTADLSPELDQKLKELGYVK